MIAFGKIWLKRHRIGVLIALDASRIIALRQTEKPRELGCRYIAQSYDYHKVVSCDAAESLKAIIS